MSDSIWTMSRDGGAQAASGLDLTGRVKKRLPIVIDNPLPGHNGDFTVVLQAAAVPHSAEAYDIVSAAVPGEQGETGWRIGVQANGAWFWKASDGGAGYDYSPTPRRQSIRGEAAKQVAFSYSAEKAEVRLYYDGLNVAIYDAGGLSGLNDAGQVWIGGSIAAAEDEAEKPAFYGTVGDVSFYDRVLSADDIARSAGNPIIPDAGKVTDIKVMNFNIWNGGRESGKEIGVERVVDVIRDSGADVVSMQETYGSGPKIADALGYYFYLRSSNLSIMSRYPIGETYPVFEPFHCGGAEIALSPGQTIRFYTLWLHWLPDYWGDMKKPERISEEAFIQGEHTNRMPELMKIIAGMEAHIAEADSIPLFVCGDFNSGSHLDWTEATKELHNGYAYPFPQSAAMLNEGFRDAYRDIHPDPLADPATTWPADPASHESMADRIDFIYYKGHALAPVDASRIADHTVHYPSDHAAVTATFRLR